MSTSQHEVGAAVSSRFLLAGFVYSPLLNRNGATSETPGGLSTEKGIGPADGKGGKPDARREQAVEHAFAHPGGDARGDAVADELLQQAVADRHAAGDREMGADRARELDEAEQARPAAVDFGDASHQPDDLGDDKNDVENRARADRGHDRHALGGGGDLALRLVVEGTQKRALSDVDQVAPVDDRARRIVDLRAGVSHLGPIAVERDKSTDETPRRGAIVGRARLGEGDMHFRDPRLAPDRDDLARRDADEAGQEHKAEHERR